MASNSLSVSIRDGAAEKVEHRFNLNPQATREFMMPSRLRNQSGDVRDPYRQHGLTYAASRALAVNIAQVPFLLHVGASEEDEDVLRDGPWVELFDRPNPEMMTRATFWETTILKLLEPCGMAVWVKESGNDEAVGPQDVPAELWPISGRFFKPVVNKVTKLIEAWMYTPPDSAKPVFYDPSELVIHRFTDPENSAGGLGPYAPAHLAIQSDYQAARYNVAFFVNDATPSGLLLKEAGNLTPQQQDQIREAWNEHHQGIDRRRRIAVLTGGLKYQDTGSTHREMEFEKGRAFAWKEELAIIGTPEYEIGLTQNINKATAEMISKDWVTKRWLPIMRMLEDGMWSQLFRPVEGDARSFLFADARMLRRRREAGRMSFPGAERRLAQARSLRAYDEYRSMTREGMYNPSPMRVNPGVSVWGEFDLTTIEALREDFAAKMTQAREAQKMGVPFNQINERLDLGFEKLEGDAGETSFIDSSLTPIDLKLNPPEPTMSGGVPPKKDDSPSSPKLASAEEKPPASKKEEKPDAKEEQKKMLRAKVEAFNQRRPLDREVRWTRMIKATKPIEDKFRSKYKRWLNELREQMMKKLAAPVRASKSLSKDEIERILFDATAAKRRLTSLAHGVYVEASQKGVESAMNDLGGNFAFDVVDPKVVDAIEKRELVLSKSTDTLRNRVKRDLEKGVEAGETIHELQDRLRQDFNSFSGARSLMIARTEVAAATNTARNLVYAEEGVEQTEWITARDEAVRDTHADIDGDKATIGTPFDNGLLHPGDPNGDPGEVINCRCIAIPVVGRGFTPSSVRKAREQELHARECELAKAKLETEKARAENDKREYRVPEIRVVVPPTPAPVVNVPPAIVNVAAPIVNVPPAVVNVAAPPAPIVNVAAPIVNVESAKPDDGEREIEYQTDDAGNVIGYTVKKTDGITRTIKYKIDDASNVIGYDISKPSKE